MLRFKNWFIFIVVSVLSGPAFAADKHYTIFIDAGSSGSRIHVFEYEASDSLPIIQNIFSEKTEPGLSSFAKTPESASLSLKNLLDHAAALLQKNGVATRNIPVNILATAGMRLITEEQQQKIYHNITNYISANYDFSIGKIETISGKMEGLYGWLDVNYLAENFQHQRATVGIIEMGGASTQIAFASEDHMNAEDEMHVHLAGKNYKVFAKSFLGLGQDQARAAMKKHADARTCYPKEHEWKHSVLGDFDFAKCSKIYQDVIQKHNVTQQLIPLDSHKFVAYSAIYSIYNRFLGVAANPDAVNVAQHIQNACQYSWDSMQSTFNGVPMKHLGKSCAGSVYSYQLLFGTYKLQDNQLMVTDKINQKSIDWTLGAALYSLLP